MDLFKLLFFSTLVSSASFPTGFEAGWNGLAKQPPMAWRTYNAQYDFLTFPPSAATSTSSFFLLFPDETRVFAASPTLLFVQVPWHAYGSKRDGGVHRCAAIERPFS